MLCVFRFLIFSLLFGKHCIMSNGEVAEPLNSSKCIVRLDKLQVKISQVFQSDELQTIRLKMYPFNQLMVKTPASFPTTSIRQTARNFTLLFNVSLQNPERATFTTFSFKQRVCYVCVRVLLDRRAFARGHLFALVLQ